MKKNIAIITLTVLVLLISSWFYNYYRNSKSELKVIKQNQAAATEELQEIKLKNDNLATGKAAYVKTIKELKESNSEFAEKIEQYKKLGTDIISGTEVKGSYYKENQRLKDSIADLKTVLDKPGILIQESTINWSLKNENRKLIGESKVRGIVKYDQKGATLTLESIGSKIKEDSLLIELELVTRVDRDGIRRVYARSDQVNIQQINSVIIPDAPALDPTEEKDKHWSLNIHGGYGVNYSIRANRIQDGFQVGIGISYNLVSW